MNNGWVKLHRQIEDSGLWLLEPFTKAQAWIDLFLNASHKNSSFSIRGNVIDLKRGQLGWSEITLSVRWRWSRNKVRRFLNYLKTKQQITQEKTFITSIITILNYDKYQSDETTDDTAERQQKDSRRYTYKNDKNDIKHIVEFMNSILKTEYKTTTVKTNQLIHERLKEGFTVENFKTVILKKHKEWRYNPDMVKFLRPETLFGVKFESYLNQHENNPEKEKLEKIQTATEYLTEKEMERKSV